MAGVRRRGTLTIVIVWCSDWPKIVILLHRIACNFERYDAHRRSLLQEASAREDASRPAVHVDISDTMRLRKTQRHAPPYNTEIGDTYNSRERNCAGEKIDNQNVYKRESSSASKYTSGTDCYKSKIYGNVRVWANAWDVFRRTPSRASRGGRGRPTGVDFVFI